MMLMTCSVIIFVLHSCFRVFYNLMIFSADLAEAFETLYWLPLTIDMPDLNNAFDAMFWLPSTEDVIDWSETFNQMFRLPLTYDMNDISVEMNNLFDVATTASVDNNHGCLSAYDLAMKSLFAPRTSNSTYNPISSRSLQQIRFELFDIDEEDEE